MVYKTKKQRNLAEKLAIKNIQHRILKIQNTFQSIDLVAITSKHS